MTGLALHLTVANRMRGVSWSVVMASLLYHGVCSDGFTCVKPHRLSDDDTSKLCSVVTTVRSSPVRVSGSAAGAAFLWCVCSSYMLSGSLFVIAALRLAPSELTSPESSAAQLLVEDERGGDEDGGEGEDAAGAGTSKV